MFSRQEKELYQREIVRLYSPAGFIFSAGLAVVCVVLLALAQLSVYNYRNVLDILPFVYRSSLHVFL